MVYLDIVYIFFHDLINVRIAVKLSGNSKCIAYWFPWYHQTGLAGSWLLQRAKNLKLSQKQAIANDDDQEDDNAAAAADTEVGNEKGNVKNWQVVNGNHLLYCGLNEDKMYKTWG